MSQNNLAKCMSHKLRDKAQSCSIRKAGSDHGKKIDLDALPDAEKASGTCEWTMGMLLEDKEVLTTDGWLNDRIINASQHLIAEAFPAVDGFQDMTLGETLAFGTKQLPFIQVLHISHGHWVTASNYGCDVGEIDVYDSMSPALSTSLKQQQFFFFT